MIKFIYRSDDGAEAPMSITFDSIEDAYLDLCLSDWEPDGIEYEEDCGFSEEEELFDDY